MNVYTLSEDANYLGEKHETYGWSVWAKVKELPTPVMFNTSREGLMAGAQIVAQDSEPKTSAKGTKYLRLKKVSVGEAVQQSLETAPPDKSKLDAIHGDIKLLLSMVRQIQKASDIDSPVTAEDLDI